MYASHLTDLVVVTRRVRGGCEEGTRRGARRVRGGVRGGYEEGCEEGEDITRGNI